MARSKKNKKKQTISRKFRLNRTDGTSIDLELVKATAIRTNAGMFHLDKLKDESYRLTVSDDIISDMTLFDNLEMIRDD